MRCFIEKEEIFYLLLFSMSFVDDFYQIRDIAYRIPLLSDEVNQCCSGKCIQLQQAGIQYGYDLRFRVCSFLWSDLPLHPDLLTIPHNDHSTHVYCEYTVWEIVCILDPTRDIGLAKIFPVNDRDGLWSTTIAVIPQEIYSLEESAKIMTNTDNDTQDLQDNRSFYQALNEWLASIRVGWKIPWYPQAVS